MTSHAYLAVDLGAESGRTIVGVLENDKLMLHETHRFLHLPRRLPNGLHWDLTGLWGNILEGCRASVAWAKGQGVQLRSLGVDTWGVDWALLGKSGDVIGMPRCYRDERHMQIFQPTVNDLTEEFLWEQTGIQFHWLNTLYQVASLHQHAPEMLRIADRLVFIPDLLHYFFTGKPVVESSIASTSQMINPTTGQWATPVLDRLGVPTQMLGEIVPPGTVLGKVLPHVATEIGLETDLPVITPATHDTASAVAAVPANADSNWLYISSGTWSLMGAELDAPCLSEAARAVPFTNEGGVNGTIRFLKNISGLWLVQECRRQFEKEGHALDYEMLTKLAAEAEPLKTIVDTDHTPFASPGEMPAKLAAFAKATGQSEPKSHGECVRCCLESLALTYRHTKLQMESVLDRKFDVLHIVGGGGKNELLNQMTADATGITVVAGPHEATAAGNVLVQAMGAGDVRDLNHIRQIVTNSFSPRTYTPGDTQAWDEAYDRFLALLGAAVAS